MKYSSNLPTEVLGCDRPAAARKAQVSEDPPRCCCITDDAQLDSIRRITEVQNQTEDLEDVADRNTWRQLIRVLEGNGQPGDSRGHFHCQHIYTYIQT
ncbi:hypothetical protein LDENG_00130430 [Lucifuga dentata]|nr:hypothetical protein LDENG_00130430 [Lucifuga dentata]